MKKLLTAFPALLLFCACSTNEPAGPGNGEAVSFVVFSDVQQGYGVYSALAKHIGRIDPAPAAAFCCGDIMLRACNEAEWMNFHRSRFNGIPCNWHGIPHRRKGRSKQ